MFAYLGVFFKLYFYVIVNNIKNYNSTKKIPTQVNLSSSLMKQSIVEKKEFDRTLKLIAKDSIIVFLSIFFTYEYRLIIARISTFLPANKLIEGIFP